MRQKINLFWLLLIIGSLGLLLTSVVSALEPLEKEGFKGTVILGRPTQNTVTASITSDIASLIYLEWGESAGGVAQRSAVYEASILKPAVVVMDQLLPQKKYSYRVFYKPQGATSYLQTESYFFQPPRGEGESYDFVIQSDSHLLNKADQGLYRQSMETISSLKPDFIFDMGDTFLNDQDTKNGTLDAKTVMDRSYQQRPFFDLITRSAYLFYTIGNHEGEYGFSLDGSTDNLTILSTLARTLYYPNPIPNAFYSGNTVKEPIVGYVQNYYAFQWGEALYVSIDPYRYTEANPYTDKDGWSWTLGETQYKWFKETLESSHATYKFVFAHHAIGNMRGGAELAKLYEWGGYDRNGQYLFDSKRPGWGKPIQQIMKDTGVTIFFQGHDHLFARENVDGVVYQTLPKPAERVADREFNGVSYPEADVLLNSGFLKVRVAPEHVQVDYYRNYYVSTDSQSGQTGVVYSYTVDAEHVVKVLKNVEDDIKTYGNSGSISSEPVTKVQAVKNGSITVTYNGKPVEFDAPPFLDASGRTLVPLRTLAQQLGCTVTWEPSGRDNILSIQNDQVVIDMKIGEAKAMVNGKNVALDTASFIKDNRTYVPLRFISETFGVKTTWNETAKTVDLTTIGTNLETTTGSDSKVGLLLGIPTDTSIAIQYLTDSNGSMYYLYGLTPGSLLKQTSVVNFKSGEAITTPLSSLLPDRAYGYQLWTKVQGAAAYSLIKTGAFHTQRAVGETFSFTIQADSHRDENSDLALYEKTLLNVLADQPDFHFDLGDTFMGEKLGRTESGTVKRYLDDRAMFSIIGYKVPLFLVNGNHEGENGWSLQNGIETMAEWASQLRLTYFLNPSPNSFYTGSDAGHGNYYAFTWGEAEFIVLDPFWFSEEKPQNDEEGWDYTLGKVQYDWLVKTLSESKSAYRFVFIHNLVGGYGKDARGGAEASEFFEWGGKNADGTYGFSQNRPGWKMPIHDLLKTYKVSAVFHGHDHFYGKQERDGIVYQLVPQPSHPGADVRDAEKYSYLEGTFLPPAGHLRVTVEATGVTVDYVGSSNGASENGKLKDSYRIIRP